MSAGGGPMSEQDDALTSAREALMEAETRIKALGVVVAPGVAGRPVDMAVMGRRLAEVINLLPILRAAIEASR
jgi:hypothetical protein